MNRVAGQAWLLFRCPSLRQNALADLRTSTHQNVRTAAKRGGRTIRKRAVCRSRILTNLAAFRVDERPAITAMAAYVPELVLVQRLKRMPARDNLCTTDDGKALADIPSSAVIVVWWYRLLRTNPSAKSIPTVDVVFWYLDENDQFSEVSSVAIGLGRLGSFRIGTIWQDGKCIGEADFGEPTEFALDFSDDKWSHVSLPSEHNFSYLARHHELPNVHKDDAVSELLRFSLPGGKYLLIPCIEFLYRCYGSTSDIGRILVTYEWKRVLEFLYGSLEKDPQTWAVSPTSDVHDDDALLLATILYNRKTENIAKGLFAQVDNARANGRHKTSLRVAPWFEGPARLEARGRWISDDTYLCLEVTGMSEPQHHSYEIRRDTRSQDKPEQTEPVKPLEKTIVVIDKPHDPFPISDQVEPGGNAGSWRKPDPSFKKLGPICPFTRTTVERRYPKREIRRLEVDPPSLFSVGDAQGAPNGVSHIVHHAKRTTGDGGVLSALWAELRHLKETRPDFTSLAWYSQAQGFVESSEFRLFPLVGFDDDEHVPEGARAWLRYPDNATTLRGLLIIKAVIQGRTFYLFDLQRKKKRHGREFRDEQISGLSMSIDDPERAAEVISIVCDKVRQVSGKFSEIQSLDSSHVFRHYSQNGAFAAALTVRKALEPFGVLLSSRRP